MIITDQASYSDQVFGLFWLLGYQFSPRPAGLPDQRFWRLDRDADYGPLDGLARNRNNRQLVITQPTLVCFLVNGLASVDQQVLPLRMGRRGRGEGSRDPWTAGIRRPGLTGACPGTVW